MYPNIFFLDFKNKADILKRIKELPLFSKSIKDLKLVSALAVDESYDINDTAQDYCHSKVRRVEKILQVLTKSKPDVISNAHNHRQFKEFLFEIDNEYAGLLHTSYVGYQKIQLADLIGEEKSDVSSQHKWSTFNDYEKKYMIIFYDLICIPDYFDRLKMLEFAVLTIFGSTYICEKCFLSMNKSKPGSLGLMPKIKNNNIRT
ncbi:hypothetical protein GJ496_005598 [Pomphorhynchus laevis]|nr:hypothetical protein GJ496_005598 [Pomphorhynchus laevis]